MCPHNHYPDARKGQNKVETVKVMKGKKNIYIYVHSKQASLENRTLLVETFAVERENKIRKNIASVSFK